MKKHLKTLAKWSKFVGLLGLIIGAVFALVGFPFFYIGAIPGLILMIVSIRLLYASKSAKRLNYNLRLMQNEQDMYDETIRLFSSYFRLQAFFILMLIVVIAGVVAMVYFYPMDYFTIVTKQVLHVIPFL